jgi:uncharacterized protein
MPAPLVIVNNTPLAALWTLEKLDLLRDLFGTVWLPTAVAAEFLVVHTTARRQALAQAVWLQTVALSDPRHALIYTGLDQGEAEVLALAIEHQARLVIMDERKGRRYARRLGLPNDSLLACWIACRHSSMAVASSYARRSTAARRLGVSRPRPLHGRTRCRPYRRAPGRSISKRPATGHRRL